MKGRSKIKVANLSIPLSQETSWDYMDKAMHLQTEFVKYLIDFVFHSHAKSWHFPVKSRVITPFPESIPFFSITPKGWTIFETLAFSCKPLFPWARASITSEVVCLPPSLVFFFILPLVCYRSLGQHLGLWVACGTNVPRVCCLLVPTSMEQRRA